MGSLKDAEIEISEDPAPPREGPLQLSNARRREPSTSPLLVRMNKFA
jgi:hypothetical protein